MRRIQVGLIGYGMSGAVFHAPLIRCVPELELAAVVTSRQVPRVRVVSSVEALLSNPDIELVVVASPTSLHFEHAHAALLAGKHVVVDKPFAVAVFEADALIELAGAQGQMLSVFQNRRWDNDFLTVRHCLAQRWLGQVYYYEAHYDRFRPAIKKGWREEQLPGSGILYDLGVHLIDQALVLFGIPQSITADVLSQRPKARVPDYFHIVLDYGRTRAVLHAGTLVKEPGPHFAVHGDGGSFLKYGMDPQEEALKAGRRPGTAAWGTDDTERYGVLVTADGDRRSIETLPGAYQHYYQGIAVCLRDGATPPVLAMESRDGLRIIEAATQSATVKSTIAI